MNDTIFGKQYAQYVLDNVNKAKSSIDVVMFDWRWYKDDISHPIQLINHAIVCAVRRGVTVRAIVSSNAIAEPLRAQGVKVKLYKRSGLLHSKMFVFDRKSFIMGSHNMTGPAVRVNVESSIFSDDETSVFSNQAYYDALYSSL